MWLYLGPTALNKMHRENFLCANLDHRQASGGLAVRTFHTSLIHATISRCSLINSQQNCPAHVPASRTSWLTVVLQSFIETPTNVAAELLYKSRGSNTTRHVSCTEGRNGPQRGSTQGLTFRQMKRLWKKKIKVRHFTASVLLWFTKGLPVPAKTYTMVNVILGWHDADLMYSLCTLQALLQFRLCKNAIFVGSLWVELRRRSLSQAGLRQLQQSAVLVANERLKESCFHKPSDKHVAKQSFIFFFVQRLTLCGQNAVC